MSKVEYRPWEKGSDKLEDAVQQTRTTKEIEEGQLAVEGVRDRMKQVFKKDQALKISTYIPDPEPIRAEGETWLDDRNRGWIMKNGKKEPFSFYQDAKRPWFCPKCDKVMNSQVDDKMWLLRGKCFDCVIKEETQMRIDGTWEAYEQEKILSNQISYMKDRINEMEGWIGALRKPEVHFQDGRFERWDVDVSQMRTTIQGEIDQLKVLLQQAEAYYGSQFPTNLAGPQPER